MPEICVVSNVLPTKYTANIKVKSFAISMQATLRPLFDITHWLYSAHANICFQMKITLCKKYIGAPSIIIQYRFFLFLLNYRET